MFKRATKQETELRIAHAAELVAEGQAYSSITTFVAENMGYQEEELLKYKFSVNRLRLTKLKFFIKGPKDYLLSIGVKNIYCEFRHIFLILQKILLFSKFIISLIIGLPIFFISFLLK